MPGVQPFISTVTGVLDAKGRVCIPAPFRQILAEQGTKGVYVCPSFADPAIDGFGDLLMGAVAERLAAADPFFSAAHDDQAQAVLAASTLLTLDEQGRVRLPDPLIAHAAIGDRVTFVGMGRKFQIWDPERLAPVQAARIERVRAARAATAGEGA